MKRLFLIGLFVFFAASVAAAAQLSSDTRYVVEKAIANEQEAVARYEAYAVKATEEGYLGAAALFRACARAESIHAQRFAALLGQTPPADRKFSFAVNSTSDNLRSSIAAETAERDGVYRDAINAAKRHDEPDVAKVFDETRDAETEHGNLQAAALRDLSTMKAAKEYYVCESCGYTMEISMSRCPSCTHPGRLMQVK
jgi:rubrerythrin